MGSEMKAHPQRWDNFGNRRSAMDRAGKYLTLAYLTMYTMVCMFFILFLYALLMPVTIDLDYILTPSTLAQTRIEMKGQGQGMEATGARDADQYVFLFS